jgi:putative DNA primase/helicase
MYNVHDVTAASQPANPSVPSHDVASTVESTLLHPRPIALPVSIDQIPHELQDRNQWVAWEYQYHPGRSKSKGKPWTKVPINPHTGQNGSSTDPKTWGTLEQAVACYQDRNLSGIGFVLTTDRDSFAGVDLDHCRNPETGDITPRAEAIVARLDSYAEVSPSGAGLRIWITAKLPPDGRKRGDVEMYDTGRFLTCTGRHIAGTPTVIEQRQAAVDKLHTEIFASPPPKAKTRVQAEAEPSSTTTLDDDAIIERALGAKNGAAFAKLWAGDASDYAVDSNDGISEATAALCCHLAFWTRDHAQIDRLFRRSSLMRGKWDEPRGGSTWGAREIDNALATVQKGWKPMRPTTSGGSHASVSVTINLLDFHNTDTGNAHRFVAIYGQDMRYNHTTDRWLAWHGTHWVEDEKASVIEKFKVVMDVFLSQTSKAVDDFKAKNKDINDLPKTDERRVQLAKLMSAAKFALDSQGKKETFDALTLAKSDYQVAVTSADLDQGDHLLNCLNGTLDLSTGKLRPQRREDLLTRVTAGEYLPATADAPWESTLDLFLPDPEMRSYVQRCLGYSLYGGNLEKAIIIGYGGRDSGKTTLFSLAAKALGAYAATTVPSVFMDGYGGGENMLALNEFFRFSTRRFLYSDEIQAGAKLSAATLKRLTGGADLLVKRLYRDTIQAGPPGFVPYLCTNDYPEIPSADEALWARIRLIPFVKPDDAGLDRSMQSRMKSNPDTLSAALTWLIQGYAAYQAHGLGEPDAAREGKAAFRRDVSPLNDFIADRCVTGDAYRVQPMAFFDEYKRWYAWEQEGDRQARKLSQREFKHELEVLGFQQTKGKTAHWAGIGLVDEKHLEPAAEDKNTPLGDVSADKQMVPLRPLRGRYEAAIVSADKQMVPLSPLRDSKKLVHREKVKETERVDGEQTIESNNRGSLSGPSGALQNQRDVLAASQRCLSGNLAPAEAERVIMAALKSAAVPILVGRIASKTNMQPDAVQRIVEALEQQGRATRIDTGWTITTTRDAVEVA